MEYAQPTQRGRFTVHGRFFWRLRADEGVNLFDSMVVLDVKHTYNADEHEYHAVHPQFRAVEPGEVVPEYVATFREGSALPEWREVQPTKGESIHEFVEKFNADLALRRELYRVVRDGQPPTQARSDAADAFAYLVDGIKRREREGQRIVDIRRTGWRGKLDQLHGLLQRWWAGLLDLVERDGNALAGNDMPERRLDVPATGVRPAHVRDQLDAYGDGVLGQSFGSDEGEPFAIGRESAGWPCPPHDDRAEGEAREGGGQAQRRSGRGV